MARFLIKSHHTPEQCVASLDEVAEKNPELLNKFDWGCKAGDHTGYVTIEKNSESEARDVLPSRLRDSSEVVKLNKFTMEDIKSFHEYA